MTRIEEIQSRLAKAEPGPWFLDSDGVSIYYVFHNGDTLDRDRLAESSGADAEFIANAPTDLAYLLTELRKRDDALMAGLALADKWAALCPEDDWPENGDMSAAPLADAGRAFRAAVTAAKGDGEL